MGDDFADFFFMAAVSSNAVVKLSSDVDSVTFSAFPSSIVDDDDADDDDDEA